MDKLKAFYQSNKKAIIAFLLPVVPAVGDIVNSGEVTRASVWLVVLAVLSGAGVYTARNTPAVK